MGHYLVMGRKTFQSDGETPHQRADKKNRGISIFRMSDRCDSGSVSDRFIPSSSERAGPASH